MFNVLVFVRKIRVCLLPIDWSIHQVRLFFVVARAHTASFSLVDFQCLRGVIDILQQYNEVRTTKNNNNNRVTIEVDRKQQCESSFLAAIFCCCLFLKKKEEKEHGNQSVV
uniref:Uncharacterized protein n=1 Tax=Trypanosoma vivax (strain Y486) TaxID=1055687 RepID=G0UDC1_TRYVY|nr:hypothetical protein TVY486_1113160 [Trypanosoma vivax Y486]